jgi:UDP-N-acetylglucosamine 2-epimerase
MLVGIEEVLLSERPDYLLVYGDTNSTLAGALAAAKLGVPVAHVEAGLRSYNREMPEEINRVLADSLSSLLFCPTGVAAANLEREGITRGVFVVGDVMYDAILDSIPRAEAVAPSLLSKLEVESGKYLLATVHRASNTDDPANLANIIGALSDSGEPVVFPAHPRTAKALQQAGVVPGPNVRQLGPVSYLEMLALEKHARKVLTDSGGVQKEAMWLAVPCITMRDETEWVETVELGWNTLTGTDHARILAAIHAPRLHSTPPDVYGDGHAAENIVNVLGDA